MQGEINSLYHYCKFLTFIEKILPNNQLKLGLLKFTNDPRESKNIVFSKTTFYDGPFIKNEVLTDFVRDKCKVLCFSRNKSPYFGYEYSRMWALYGDNHKGICLKINKEKFLDLNSKYLEPEKGFFQKIIYQELDINKTFFHPHYDITKEATIGKEKYIKEFRNTYVDHLYFTKFKEWESENEVRLVYFSNTDQDEYCSIKDCIEMVYLGCDFNKVYLPAIEKFLAREFVSTLSFQDVRLVPHAI